MDPVFVSKRKDKEHPFPLNPLSWDDDSTLDTYDVACEHMRGFKCNDRTFDRRVLRIPDGDSMIDEGLSFDDGSYAVQSQINQTPTFDTFDDSTVFEEEQRKAFFDQFSTGSSTMNFTERTSATTTMKIVNKAASTETIPENNQSLTNAGKILPTSNTKLNLVQPREDPTPKANTILEKTVNLLFCASLEPTAEGVHKSTMRSLAGQRVITGDEELSRIDFDENLTLNTLSTDAYNSPRVLSRSWQDDEETATYTTSGYITSQGTFDTDATNSIIKNSLCSEETEKVIKPRLKGNNHEPPMCSPGEEEPTIELELDGTDSVKVTDGNNMSQTEDNLEKLSYYDNSINDKGSPRGVVDLELGENVYSTVKDDTKEVGELRTNLSHDSNNTEAESIEVEENISVTKQKDNVVESLPESTTETQSCSTTKTLTQNQNRNQSRGRQLVLVGLSLLVFVVVLLIILLK